MNELPVNLDGNLNSFQEGSIINNEEYNIQRENKIEELRQTREKWIIQIGNHMHKKMRLKLNNEPELMKYFVEIEKLDKEIFIRTKEKDNLKGNSQNIYNCTKCDSKVSANDKFCGSCGTLVVIPEKIEELLKSCSNCEEKISSSAVFCPCCGQKTLKSEEQVNAL